MPCLDIFFEELDEFIQILHFCYNNIHCLCWIQTNKTKYPTCNNNGKTKILPTEEKVQKQSCPIHYCSHIVGSVVSKRNICLLIFLTIFDVLFRTITHMVLN